MKVDKLSGPGPNRLLGLGSTYFGCKIFQKTEVQSGSYLKFKVLLVRTQ